MSNLLPIAMLLAIVFGGPSVFLWWESRHAPINEDWESSGDERHRLRMERAHRTPHVDPDNLIEHDAALAAIIARAEMVARDGERLWLGGGAS